MDLSRDYDDFPTSCLNRGKKSFLGRKSRILHFIMAGRQRSIPRRKVEEAGQMEGGFHGLHCLYFRQGCRYLVYRCEISAPARCPAGRCACRRLARHKLREIQLKLYLSGRVVELMSERAASSPLAQRCWSCSHPTNQPKHLMTKTSTFFIVRLWL